MTTETTPDVVRAAISRWSEPVVGFAGVALVIGLCVFFAKGWVPRDRLHSAPSDIGVLAILPFDVIPAAASPDLGQELLADLNRELGGDVTVVPRDRCAQYAGSRQTLREIASDLGADSVLVGTLVVSDSDHRVRARLVRAHDSHELCEVRAGGVTSAAIAARLRAEILGDEGKGDADG
jgi:TolB-like protein